MNLKIIAMRDAVGNSLVELGKENHKVVVLDADVCTSTKTSFFRDNFPDRFYEVGIAEANMIGISAGLSLCRFIPFVCTFAVFASKRVADQIRVSVAYPQLNVKILGSYGGIPTGKAGATHSSVEDIAIMRAMPNMRVIVPADAVEVKQVIKYVSETEGPFYISTVRCEVPTIFADDYKFEFGKGVEIFDGSDLTIMSCGMMTAKAITAREILHKEGIEARLIHLPTIKPIDKEIIIKAAIETKAILTVENHSIIGGLGSAVGEVISESAPVFLKRIGIPDKFIESGEDEAVFNKYGMTVGHIVNGAKELIKKLRVPNEERI